MKFCNGCGTQLIKDDCPNKMCRYKTSFIEKLLNMEFGDDIERGSEDENENGNNENI
jgi:hypothetical protein